MGEVYKATDTRLGRAVAIKVLPEDVAANPDLKQRFEREAQTLASISHPHICPVFDVGKHDHVDFLVMEYLEGETLEQRLKKGALPLNQALHVATQIADALAVAHRAGIIHRDLKPGNIMLTKAGVKLLDFGLAKAVAPQMAGDLSMLPTTPPNLTGHGTILGTFHYMAPEQIEGQEADARSDLFALGCVLYEMVAGRRTFEGKSAPAVMAAILERHPPTLQSVQPLTPPSLDHLVTRCLEKEPDDRWQTAGDVMRELKWIAESPAATSGTTVATNHSLSRLKWSVASVVLAAIAGTTGWLLRPASAPASGVSRVHLAITPADQLTANPNTDRPSRTAMALSPDGTRLVFSGSRNGTQQLYLRALDRLDATPVEGTEGAEGPIFSPDGQWIAFWAANELKKVPLGGGPTISICKTPRIYGASWGSNRIVFAQGEGGLWEVSADGGAPQPLTMLDVTKGEYSHRLPHMLPDGDSLLYTVQKSRLRWTDALIVVRSLATGTQRVLIEGGADARYVPTGHLLYARAGTLMAVPFDLETLTLTGGAFGIIDDVMQSMLPNAVLLDTGAAQFTVSDSGELVYLPGGLVTDPARSLIWVNRSGESQSLSVPPRGYYMPRLSPDGQRLALFTQGDRNVWVYDLNRGTLTRLTTDGQSAAPIWTPDGKRLVYESTTEGFQNLFWKAADGSGAAERLTTSGADQRAASWTPDGGTLAFVQGDPATRTDIWTLSVTGTDRAPRPLLNTAAGEWDPDFSPDGRWIAYTSNESGRPEIYVQPYPGPGPKHQISSTGGTQPAWARNGRELFFTVLRPNTPAAGLMVVDIATSPTFTAGVPRTLESLVHVNNPVRGYDVAPDGRRFITVRDNEESAEPPLTHMVLVLNFFEELEQRVQPAH